MAIDELKRHVQELRSDNEARRTHIHAINEAVQQDGWPSALGSRWQETATQVDRPRFWPRPELATELGRAVRILGLYLLRKLRRHEKLLTPGNVWHHVVEQNKEGLFPAEWIHNTGNVVEMSPTLNKLIADFYASSQPQITGPGFSRVRDWLATQSFEKNLKFGFEAIVNIAEGRWKPPGVP